jgi:hypothetical protein
MQERSMLRPYIECVADANRESIIHRGVKKEKGQRLKPGILGHPSGPNSLRSPMAKAMGLARALIRTTLSRILSFVAPESVITSALTE